MKSTSELTDFYYKTLYPTLEQLEKQRKNLKSKILKITFFYTLAFIIIIAIFLNNSNNINDIFIFGIAIYIGIGGIIYKLLIKDYTSDFKSQVIRPLIAAIDNNLSYTIDSHVPRSMFENSELFKTKIDRLSGNDYVKGVIDDVNLQFSDIHAEQKHKNSKGQDNWSTIFKGLFIVAEFHKNFKGQTIILPDTAQKSFGNLIGSWLQSKNISRDELVKMDDVEFEKKFVVYSTNQIEARYILSATLMKRLLIFQKRSKHPIYISFKGENIHIAIYYNKDLFEPSIFHSLLKYKIAIEYLSTLQLAVGIVEELKLNQKLWSKE
ncbi:MAG: DUF3137 domain-containing protein [Campylobacterota bacterium]|nr:DUF3137 domain-containing protein [Campylobacterota bacterium]